MTKEVDARGQACPRPVIMTKNALDAMTEGSLRVLVDDSVSLANVERFARNAGCSVTTQDMGNGTHAVLIEQDGGKAETPSVAIAPFVPSCGTGPGPTVVLINTDCLGQGDRELGKVLAKALIYALTETENKPSAIVFMNTGVRLTTSGSECLDNLERLGAAGVEITSCGTCLDYYGLKDQVKIGKISNMYDIVTLLMGAGRVVTP